MGKARESLDSLIAKRGERGADVRAVDERIWELFGEDWCVVFTDMCGFSVRSAQRGIVPFLVLIRHMQQICVPILEEHAGFLLKTIADSQIVLFRDPRSALRACVAMQRALHSRNRDVVESERIYLGCGVGFGPMLKLGDEDVFGVEVNFAAKLGEDIAGPYDILLTPSAVKKIGKARSTTFHRVKGSRLGGTRLPYYGATYDVNEDADHRPTARRARVRFK